MTTDPPTRASSTVRTAGGRQRPADPHEHLVGFFESDEVLVQTAADHLVSGLREGAHVAVFAIWEHTRPIRDRLTEAGVDVRAADIVWLDAADTLASFMVDGVPDPARFRDVIGGLVDRSTTRDRPVRCFGEMVSLLWDRGDLMAMLALEGLWNELAQTHDFELLCGYPVRSFADDADARAFRALCDAHTGVLPTDGYRGLEAVAPPDGDEATSEPRRQSGEDSDDDDRTGDERSISPREHDEIVSSWAGRVQLLDETLSRVRTANERLIVRLRDSQAQVRELRERVRDLRRERTSEDGGEPGG
ncbi:MAG: MEDS domain-containing protein [Actinobacteria bacterium]|nr:MEDS domain-containing protein [Actinomycetota bacterium]